MLKTCSHLDASRVAACGGSHGGFLSLHLVGQFGDVFKAAAVRNPVTNIATMYALIPTPAPLLPTCRAFAHATYSHSLYSQLARARGSTLTRYFTRRRHGHALYDASVSVRSCGR